MDSPLVSIVVPVYNREKYIGEAIESALNQTYDNIEVIIIDNCSSDRSWNIIQDYASQDNRIRCSQNEENIGPVRNWKRGLDLAQGAYCKILFSDDLMDVDFVASSLQFFDEDTAFVIGKIQIIDENKTHIDNIEYNQLQSTTSSFFLRDVLLYNHYCFPVSPGASIFRTSDLKKVLKVEIENPLNLQFSRYGAGNDLLIYLEISLLYPTIRLNQQSGVYFRRHSGSLSVENKLSAYYDFAKLFFVEMNYPALKNDYYWYLSVRRMKGRNAVHSLVKSKKKLTGFMPFLLNYSLNLVSCKLK